MLSVATNSASFALFFSILSLIISRAYEDFLELNRDADAINFTFVFNVLLVQKPPRKNHADRRRHYSECSHVGEVKGKRKGKFAYPITKYH